MGRDKPTVEEVEEALFDGGRLMVSDYFIVDIALLIWQKHGPHAGPMVTLIEDADLARACRDYLLSQGVPQYKSITEALAARGLAD
jgi:hypothetical protein